MESLTIPMADPKPLVLAETLRHYWYPVARSNEVVDAPVAVKLLSEPLVLWRDPSGGVAAFYDLCIHRGTPLSLGWVDGETLVCRYHGWGYTADGACVRIPSLPCGAPIPRKARATAYRTQERHGLVWVCLGEPVADLPPVPVGIDDPGWGYTTEVTEYFLHANAARFVENTLDYSHFAWVHPGILGDREHPETQDTEIQHLADGFEYMINRFGVVRTDLPADEPPYLVHYKVVLPFNVYITFGVPAGHHGVGVGDAIHYWFCSPLSTTQTKIFFVSHGLRSETEEERPVDNTIFEQDRDVVESQRPEELPLDLREELHLRGPDATGLEYRRYLGRIGVEWA